MAEVIDFEKFKRNVQHATTDELKVAWDAWDGDPLTMFKPFDMEAVYFELNRRGEGAYCAV